MQRKEVILKQETVHTGRVFVVRRDTVQIVNGETREFTIVQHPGAVVVLPVLSDGTMLMVRQWRRAVQAELLEFPAGTLEVGEDPLDCAKRELIEETCHAAAEWISLGELLPAPGFCSERQYCYLARDLSPSAGELDEDEIIEVQKLTKAQFVEFARTENAIDGKTLAIYQRAIARGLL